MVRRMYPEILYKWGQCYIIKNKYNLLLFWHNNYIAFLYKTIYLDFLISTLKTLISIFSNLINYCIVMKLYESIYWIKISEIIWKYLLHKYKYWIKIYSFSPFVPKYMNPYPKTRVLRKIVGVIILFHLCKTFTNLPLYLMYSTFHFYIPMRTSSIKKDIFEKRVVIASRNL
jgi:hypothetical protein